jgi:hypothetical protein
MQLPTTITTGRTITVRLSDLERGLVIIVDIKDPVAGPTVPCSWDESDPTRFHDADCRCDYCVGGRSDVDEGHPDECDDNDSDDEWVIQTPNASSSPASGLREAIQRHDEWERYRHLAIPAGARRWQKAADVMFDAWRNAGQHRCECSIRPSKKDLAADEISWKIVSHRNLRCVPASPRGTRRWEDIPWAPKDWAGRSNIDTAGW